MTITVGIPRALLYYYYYPAWRAFFAELGVETVLSPASNKGILTEGIRHAVDDICLPVKMAFGHVISLAGKADYILMPRMVSVAKREYICPKFLGLPDLVRRLPGIPPLIDVHIDLYKGKHGLYNAAKEAGSLFTGNGFKIWRAYRRAMLALKNYFRLLELGLLPEEAMAVMENRVMEAPHGSGNGLKLAVIGHPYNVYDRYISMDVLRKLRRMGASVLTAENASEKDINRYASFLPKKLFWTLGRRMVGAAGYYMGRAGVDGMVYVAAFGCGPDSMTGELIQREARARRIPFLNLNIDEHTGEAGVVTRLEAFLDMVRWRRCG
ncbi:MAG: acyl-CoA dehydratase activase-related protein [Firmicutes bacterium]|nr:acyl-CoA dehydratase activase-related protein [Bacillota bacterium]